MAESTLEHAPSRTAVVITATEPEPRSFGKQVVLGGLLDHLCQRLGAENVHVILIGRTDVPRPVPAYRQHVVAKPAARDQVAALAGRVLLGPHTSLQEAALWSQRIAREIRILLETIDADIEVWDTMRAGQYARSVPRRRRVLYADDLFSKRYASMLEQIRAGGARIRNPLGEFQKVLPGVVGRVVAQPAVYTPLLRLEKHLTQRSERAAPGDFDATLLVNADEAAELRSITGDASVTTLLPLLKEQRAGERRFAGAPRFVFLGGLDYAPNRDGLEWFLANCRDEVLRALPDFELLVIGRGTDTLPAQADAWDGRVRGLGWVDDLDAELGTAAAMLSPLRIGSGTKIKVLEALARGLPVVATPHGVLGLGVGADDGCLVGTSPEELAAHLRSAVDRPVNATLSARASATWRDRFSPVVAGRDYDAVLGLEGVRRP